MENDHCSQSHPMMPIIRKKTVDFYYCRTMRMYHYLPIRYAVSAPLASARGASCSRTSYEGTRRIG
eukprot:6177618-Pleurochrysis_carterae.AAC.2